MLKPRCYQQEQMMFTLTVDLKLHSSLFLNGILQPVLQQADLSLGMFHNPSLGPGSLQLLQPSSIQEFLLHKRVLGNKIRSLWRMFP